MKFTFEEGRSGGRNVMTIGGNAKMTHEILQIGKRT